MNIRKLGLWSSSVSLAAFIVYTICFAAIWFINPPFTWTNPENFIAYTAVYPQIFKYAAMALMPVFSFSFIPAAGMPAGGRLRVETVPRPGRDAFRDRVFGADQHQLLRAAQRRPAADRGGGCGGHRPVRAVQPQLVHQCRQPARVDGVLRDRMPAGRVCDGPGARGARHEIRLSRKRGHDARLQRGLYLQRHPRAGAVYVYGAGRGDRGRNGCHDRLFPIQTSFGRRGALPAEKLINEKKAMYKRISPSVY